MFSPLIMVCKDTAIGVCAYCVPDGEAIVFANPSAVKPITTVLPATTLRSSAMLTVSNSLFQRSQILACWSVYMVSYPGTLTAITPASPALI